MAANMEMATEMDMQMEEEFFEEQFYIEELHVEIDFDYEFDAPKFYDLTQLETDFEAQEAGLWFATAPSYCPSPHVIEWKWRLEDMLHDEDSSCFIQGDENVNPNLTATNMDDEGRGVVCHSNGVAPDIAKDKARSPPPKCSSFMNPTACQLAKQVRPPTVLCDRLLRRLKKLTLKNEDQSSCTSSDGAQDTKRQKLEAGYIPKIARLKHQVSFQRKVPIKVGQLDAKALLARPKNTIPKEPHLETANRAVRHRSKNVLESAENVKSKPCNFKARPLNRKILNAPSLPLLEKRTPRPPQFQEFHLRTAERARQHASTNGTHMHSSRPASQQIKDYRRVNSTVASKEKPEALYRSHSFCLYRKELKNTIDEKSPAERPAESLNKV